MEYIRENTVSGLSVLEIYFKLECVTCVLRVLADNMIRQTGLIFEEVDGLLYYMKYTM